MSVLAVRSARALWAASVLGIAALGSGCIGFRIVHPVVATEEELRAFEAAGPADLLPAEIQVASMQVGGPYRVVPGDLLEIALPPEVGIESPSGESGPGIVTVKARVKEDGGTVLLPLVGEQPVAGMTTGEIEQALASAYHDPARLERRPNVVVTVAEHKTVTVAVTGAVATPGLHELRSDHMTVVGALMAAGGVKGERGAKSIRVLSSEDGRTVERVVEVGFGAIPFSDLALRGGETVVVEPAAERSFTVLGLVKRSGIFPYPVPRRFNLMQALATAGGVDETAAPRYATIYRRRADGSVLAATFRIDGTALQDGSNVQIKDGDVIAVEHTQGSWLRLFFSQVLGFRANATVSTSTTTL